ncbi:hypothetical protein [Flavobacterium caeni]|uniref:DKNYY family protein n=1 Tax=Flavobacterium caeni TaxID=490189 RepID=A0A1G5GY58_9FLAO|nr:hypothetical protein [Flavobacterium caeni]SCY56525.1 hypothetical protein SAMN02927903_01683 [Flavobacterium caeni]
MKKTVLFVSLLAVLFGACSESDTANPNPANEQPLVRKISYTKFNTGGGIDVQAHQDFFYVNRVLSHTIDYRADSAEFFRTDYTFENEKLLTIKTTQSDHPEAGGLSTLIYEGDNLQRMESVAYAMPWYTRTDFEYQGDNLIQNLYGAPKGQTEPMELLNRRIKQFDNGNIVTTNFEQFAFPPLSFTDHYSYDNSNNPFKNMNRYFRMTINVSNIHPLSNNNYVTEADDSGVIWYDFEVICNQQQYPVSIKRYLHQDHRLVEQTDIEYL